MPTIIAAATGDWSASGTWTGGVVPGDGDTADLNGKIVTMDILTVPASGTLAGIISPGTTGRLALTLSGSNSYVINATTIIGGEAAYIIYVAGDAPSATLTVNGNITGGISSVNNGLSEITTGTVIINGNVNGGTGSVCYGVDAAGNGAKVVNGNIIGGRGAGSGNIGLNLAGGTLAVNGNVTGGLGPTAYGIYVGNTTVATVVGNLIWSGVEPIFTDVGGTAYLDALIGSYLQYLSSGANPFQQIRIS